jgi:type II restriction/modification system DNA methylase subunit YeeA
MSPIEARQSKRLAARRDLASEQRLEPVRGAGELVGQGIGLDVTNARRLAQNADVAFEGDKKGGPFEISEAAARQMLSDPNPDHRNNRDVIFPWVNGKDVTGRSRGMWIIDFGVDMAIGEAALYEAPFEYVKQHVMPVRVANRRAAYATRWWLHSEPRTGMRMALLGLKRFLVTPNVSKHRVFVWLDAGTLPANSLIAIAREDDFSFGVLQSSVHEVWARRHGGQVREVESGFRYTPTTTFETFPFPAPMLADQQRVAGAARSLDHLRRGWLDPPGADEATLRMRTLTRLYNNPPTWLQQAHESLDRAVYQAYGWTYPQRDDEIVARLAALNLS